MKLTESKRARRRRAGKRAEQLRIERAERHHAAAQQKRAHQNGAWETAPLGVLMYYLRMARPEKPLTRSFSIHHVVPGSRYSAGFSWDAPYGLVLRCDNQPFACIAYRIQKDAVIVVQIQGSLRGKRFFPPFDWEAVLLDAVVHAARANRYRRVDVQPANVNRWNRNRLFARRFARRYDETARKLGFSQQHRYEHYRLLL